MLCHIIVLQGLPLVLCFGLKDQSHDPRASCLGCVPGPVVQWHVMLDLLPT